MLDVYADFCKDALAIPVVKGQKTEKAIVRRRCLHLLHQGADARRQGAPGGHLPAPGDGFAEAFDVSTPTRKTSAARRTRPAGA